MIAQHSCSSVVMPSLTPLIHLLNQSKCILGFSHSKLQGQVCTAFVHWVSSAGKLSPVRQDLLHICEAPSIYLVSYLHWDTSQYAYNSSP